MAPLTDIPRRCLDGTVRSATPRIPRRTGRRRFLFTGLFEYRRIFGRVALARLRPKMDRRDDVRLELHLPYQSAASSYATCRSLLRTVAAHCHSVRPWLPLFGTRGAASA